MVGGCVVAATALVGSSARLIEIEDFARRHRGVVYAFGACTDQKMDCSCFARRLYRELFGLDIPRTTLTQAAALAAYRVDHIGSMADLRTDRLCVGDLIYTHQGSSWQGNPRHVVVYAGSGRLIHAWRGSGRVGLSPLSWLKRFRLHGVYRPLACETPGTASRGGSRIRIGAAGSGDDVLVRTLIEQYVRTWKDLRSERLRTLMWSDALQARRGGSLDVDGMVAAHRETLDDVKAVEVDQDAIESLVFWGDIAIVDLRYDLALTYESHRELRGNLRETLILERRGSQWRISRRDGVLGD